MNIIFGIVLAYLVLPIIGEIFIYTTGINLYAGSVDIKLITYNIIHASIILLFAYKATRTNNLQINIIPYKPNRIIVRCAIVALIGLVIVFMTSGYRYFILDMDRGDIRVGLGFTGIVSTWVIRFLLPAVLALSTLTFIQSVKRTTPSGKTIYYLTWVLVILSAVSTGYKAPVISMLLPALSILFFHKKVLGLAIKVVPVALIVLSISTAVVRNTSISDGFYFLMHRMTVMVAYGTVGMWNNFPDGAGFSEAIKLSYNIFGNNVAELILGHSQNSVEFLSTNLSRLVTYLAYPNTTGALNGTVNVTVTNFGEAYYMFGNWFPVYSVFSGIIFYLLILKFKQSLKNNKLTMAIIMLTFIHAILLPWLNSSSIFILISLPTIVWISMTLIVLYLIQYARFVLR